MKSATSFRKMMQPFAKPPMIIALRIVDVLPALSLRLPLLRAGMGISTIVPTGDSRVRQFIGKNVNFVTPPQHS